jgi:hypothetical protein
VARTVHAVNISELAFLIGPVAGPLLVAGSLVAIVVTTRRPRVVFPAAGLAFAVMASFVTHWFFWGKGFDAADAGREVPAGVQSALNISAGVGAATAAALAVLTAVVLASRRRRRGIVGAPSAS